MIYDCFLFYDELELLELRLSLLDGLVDRFVLVEAGKSFDGKDKPFFFSEKSSRFSSYLPKITCIKVKDMPDSTDRAELERHQRNCTIRAWKRLRPYDYLILSDVDEIPSPSALDLLGKDNALSERLDSAPLVCSQSMHYRYVNCVAGEPWLGSVIIKANMLGSPQELRDMRAGFEAIEEAGWHFSGFGGTERARRKTPVPATPRDSDALKSPRQILHCMAEDFSLFGRRDGNSLSFRDFDADRSNPCFKNWLRGHPRFLCADFGFDLNPDV